MINDAAMQALGSYKGGTMLFLGLGTGLGSALVVNGTVVPMELGHLPCRKGTFEDYLGVRGLEKQGKKEWRKSVSRVVERFTSALFLDDVVLGGGNAKKLKELPPGCRLGDNANAFEGGFRLWKEPGNDASRPMRKLDESSVNGNKEVGKEHTMQLGMIGLGRMGANMVRRLIGGGHECVVFDMSPEGRGRARQGEGGRRLLSRRLREEAREAPGRLADGAGGRRRPVRSPTSCRSSRRATS